MTLTEAESVVFTVKAIKDAESLNHLIQKLLKEGKHEEIARIALELNSELKRVYEDKLSNM
jgi:microsomal dipeptidase-like Zn-dependent dipeptidase